MDWGSVAEWATVALAALAIVGSFYALSQTTRISRRVLYADMHSKLASHEASEGRHLIYEHCLPDWSDEDVKRFQTTRRDDWNRINYSLALWNTLAQYARNGLIEKKWADKLWGDTVVEAWPRLEPLIRFRRTDRADKWSSLAWFAQRNKAELAPDLAPQP